VIAENILDKYAKVWTLADSGAPEAHAAKTIMQGMEKKYPGIRQQAHALRTALNGQYSRHDPRSTESEGRPWEEVYHEQQQRQQWNNQNGPDWRKMAASAFNFASQYAYQAFGAMEADGIAQRVKVEGRGNQSGSVSIIGRFDKNLWNYASLLAPAQKEMIAGMVAERIKQEIIFQLNKDKK
jgi:hypothetical protein